MMFKLPEKYVITSVLILLTIFFLATPFVARSLQGNDALLGEQSYFHLGLAQNIAGQTAYPFHETQATLFDVLVAGILGFINPLVTGKLLPLLFGIIAVVVFLYIAQKECIDAHEKVIASLLFIISPLFIIIFTTLTPTSLMIVLFLGALASYEKIPLLSGVLTLIIMFINAKAFVTATLLILAFGLSKKNWKPAAIIGGVGLIIMILTDAVFGFIASEQLIVQTSFHDFFASLGAQFGYSFFILFLAFVGIIGFWSNKREFLLSSVFVIGVFIFSFSDIVARALLLPIIALFAGKGLLLLLRRKWSSIPMRNATLFLIGLSLLFTLVMTVSDQVKSEPTIEKMEALLFLQSVPDNNIVLSSKENGIYLERIAKHPAFLDSISQPYQVMWNDDIMAQRIFYAQRMSVASSILVEKKISYIFIDEQMRNGAIWTFEEQGLLFLVENSVHFVKLFENSEVSVYRFIPS